MAKSKLVLAVGDKLWRPLAIMQDGSFGWWMPSWLPISDRGDAMAHAHRALDHPDAAWSVPVGHRFYASTHGGFVCFSRQRVPNNWTYLEVTGLSRSGTAAFVVPVSLPSEEVLRLYSFGRSDRLREQMNEVLHNERLLARRSHDGLPAAEAGLRVENYEEARAAMLPSPEGEAAIVDSLVRDMRKGGSE